MAAPDNSTSFCNANLPRTMEIAELARRHLTSKIARTPRTWPFEDRVLAYLLPELGDAIRAFHGIGGPDLLGVLKTTRPETIANFDKQLMADLVRALRQVLPRLHRLIVDAARGARRGSPKE